MEDQGRINVAITGALSEPRAKIAEKINASRNGRFVECMNLQTHYLVCEKHDSQKAKKAGTYGTTVISEAELLQILEVGEFPSVALPSYQPGRPNNFPDIHWTEFFEPARWYRLTYRDASGNWSVRTIIATAQCGEWLGAYDGPDFKTFRADRIVSLEPIKDFF